MYVLLFALAVVCAFMRSSLLRRKNADEKNLFTALLDSWLLSQVSFYNITYAFDVSVLRIFPATAVCVVYVYNTYQRNISNTCHIVLASYGLFALANLTLQILIDYDPLRFVCRYEFVVEVFSLVSLILARGKMWLNFSFLQAHIVLVRYIYVRPVLEVLLGKKSRPLYHHYVNMLIVFFINIYIFASGLQLFELLGDPLTNLLTTTLELTLLNALYFTFVTVFTVGYGDFIPYTLFGRGWMVLVITVGVIIVSYKITKFHELVSTLNRHRGDFVKGDAEEHCVICGNIKWEYLKPFVQEFYSDIRNRETKLVVMSEPILWTEQDWNKFCTPHSLYKSRVSYFEGSCMNEEDLDRAKLKSALAVFVLNNQHNPNVYVEDSETLKRILTIRSFAPDIAIYTMCALTDSMFQITYALEHATVSDPDSGLSNSGESPLNVPEESDGMINTLYDGMSDRKSEVICMQDVEMSMLAENVFCNGVSTLLSNLLLRSKPTVKADDDKTPWIIEYKTGTENSLEFVQIPRQMDNIAYGDVALMMFDYGLVLLATKTYFDDGWRPITPSTRLSHSSIGLVLTFMARTDLDDIMNVIAEECTPATPERHEYTEFFDGPDELSHKTSSWHEIAGARLTGDGPNDVIFFGDEVDPNENYDSDDEAEDGPDEDSDGELDEDLQDCVEGTDVLHVNVEASNVPKHAQDVFLGRAPLPLSQQAVSSEPFLEQAPALLSTPRSPFDVCSSPASEAGDSTFLDSDTPTRATEDSFGDRDTARGPVAGEELLAASSSHLQRSQEKNEVMFEEPPPVRSEEYKAETGGPSRASSSEFGAPASEGKAGGSRKSPNRRPKRRASINSARDSVPLVPIFSSGGTGPSPRQPRDLRPVDVTETPRQQESRLPVPRLRRDATRRRGPRSTSLDIEQIQSLPVDLSSTLDDMRPDEEPLPRPTESLLIDIEIPTEKLDAILPGVTVDDRFHPSVPQRPDSIDLGNVRYNDEDEPDDQEHMPMADIGNGAPTSQTAKPRARSVSFPKLIDEADGDGHTRLSQKEPTAQPKEFGAPDASADPEQVKVWYGDPALPHGFRNHVLVCVIGQMGMMNLKQFLVRLGVKRKGQTRDTPVVAICPKVSDEDIQDLSELDRAKLHLIQGNSLSVSTLRSALYNKARSIIVLACEDKSDISDMDARAIFTIMTLDHLIEENANIFVCSMLDSEESMHLLRPPYRARRRGADLGVLNHDSRGPQARATGSSYMNYGTTIGSHYATARPGTYGGAGMYSADFLRAGSGGFLGRRPFLRMEHGVPPSRSFLLSRAVGRTGRDEDIRRAINVDQGFAERREFALRMRDIEHEEGFPQSPLNTRFSYLLPKSSANFGGRQDTAISGLGSSAGQRQDPAERLVPAKLERVDRFEKQRYASGEMMISSMFIALLVREFTMPGLTEVVGQLFGTSLETQPCWVRSIRVPKSWIPNDSSKGLEYRDLCQKLLENGCVPLGLYRSGSAPVRMQVPRDDSDGDDSQDEGELQSHDAEEGPQRATVPAETTLVGRSAGRATEIVRLHGGPENLGPRYGSTVNEELLRNFDDIEMGGEALPNSGDDALGILRGGAGSSKGLMALGKHASGENAPTEASPDDYLPPIPVTFLSSDDEAKDTTIPRTPSSGFSDQEDFVEVSTYRFLTNKRVVRYRELTERTNALPYVYTNPEAYTVVSEHDAVYVLADPAISLKHLR